MTSEEMICPHCRARLRKSAAAHVLGSTRSLVMGDLPGSTPCPACGGPLGSAAMIRGDYDLQQAGCVAEAFRCLVSLVVGWFIIAACAAYLTGQL